MSPCGAGGSDVWLVKADSEGGKEWDKTFGGTDDDYASSVQGTSDGGYVLAGYTKSYGVGGSDFWLIKVRGEADLTLIGDGTRGYALDELRALPSYTAGGGFKRSTGAIVGPFKYTGVSITYLAELVGGIMPSNSMKITASDGYLRAYTYEQAIGDITTYEGTTRPITMVLAYEGDENPISSDCGGPLRIVFVGSDSPITDGHFWCKCITKIEILGGVDDWNLTLTGDLNSDNQITPTDAAIALELAATGGWDANADVNHDSRITSLDALMILRAAGGTIEL